MYERYKLKIFKEEIDDDNLDSLMIEAADLGKDLSLIKSQTTTYYEHLFKSILQPNKNFDSDYIETFEKPMTSGTADILESNTSKNKLAGNYFNFINPLNNDLYPKAIYKGFDNAVKIVTKKGGIDKRSINFDIDDYSLDEYFNLLFIKSGKKIAVDSNLADNAINFIFNALENLGYDKRDLIQYKFRFKNHLHNKRKE